MGLLKKQRPSRQFPGSELEVDNWRISETILEKIVPVVGIHPFPLNELMLLAASVDKFQPSLIFEWGTHVGKSARIFYELTHALGLNTTIHSIDLPDDAEHGEHPHSARGEMVRGIKSVKLHQGDGVETALGILGKQKGRQKEGEGVIFLVDGDHSYESVKRELSAIIKHAPKAAILLHDTFYQSSESKYNVGPYQAINDCLKNNAHYRRIDTATGLPGMTLLYPI